MLTLLSNAFSVLEDGESSEARLIRGWRVAFDNSILHEAYGHNGVTKSTGQLISVLNCQRWTEADQDFRTAGDVIPFRGEVIYPDIFNLLRHWAVNLGTQVCLLRVCAST